MHLTALAEEAIPRFPLRLPQLPHRLTHPLRLPHLPHRLTYLMTGLLSHQP